MRVLLDTNTFLWMLEGSSAVSRVARGLIDSAETDRMLSVASLWEIAIKQGIGKLGLPEPFAETLLRQVRAHDVRLLPVAAAEALAVAHLPHHHKDPFDRLLVAQCLLEDVPIISADAGLDAYGVRRIW